MARPKKIDQIKEVEVALREVLIEIEQRKKANPSAFLIPNGKQEEFLKLPEFVNVFSTGNGVGKTIIAVNIITNLIWGSQNEWFDNPRYKDFPRPSRGRIVSTHKNIKESIIPKLYEWFPKARFITRKEKQEYEAHWITDVGSEFDIMTYDTEPEQFEGPTLHWILFDEPPPYRIFGACISRLREGGVIIITMTPVYSGGWIFDRINNPWVNQSKWNILYADIENNCIEHGVRGTLKHKNIQRMIEEYPPEEREARIKGLPIQLSGKVYQEFDPSIHIIPRHKAPIEGTLFHVNDPHDRKPFALGWYLMDKTGDIYVIDEWPNQPFHEMKSCNLNIQDYGKIIEDKETIINLPIDTRIIDARYGNRKNVHTNTTIRDDFDDYKSDKFPDGITYLNSYTDDDASILAGHNAVKELLRYDKSKPLSNTNKPKLYVCDNCTNHIYQFLHYSYADYKDPEKALKEKVDEKYKDFMDLVRYLVCELKSYSILDKDTKDSVNSTIEDIIPEHWQKFREPVQTGYGV
jgi:phage terminase large subunit-like protein